jgi:hypothetical protein
VDGIRQQGQCQSSHCQIVTMSNRHNVKSSQCQIVTMSNRHNVKSSQCQIVAMSIVTHLPDHFKFNHGLCRPHFGGLRDPTAVFGTITTTATFRPSFSIVGARCFAFRFSCRQTSFGIGGIASTAVMNDVSSITTVTARTARPRSGAGNEQKRKMKK